MRFEVCEIWLQMCKWIKLKLLLLWYLNFRYSAKLMNKAATYEVNGCIIYADHRASRKLVLPKRPPETYMILNVVEYDCDRPCIREASAVNAVGLVLVTIDAWIIYYAIVFVSNFVPLSVDSYIYYILFLAEQFYRIPYLSMTSLQDYAIILY